MSKLSSVLKDIYYQSIVEYSTHLQQGDIRSGFTVFIGSKTPPLNWCGPPPWLKIALAYLPVPISLSRPRLLSFFRKQNASIHLKTYFDGNRQDAHSCVSIAVCIGRLRKLFSHFLCSLITIVRYLLSIFNHYLMSNNTPPPQQSPARINSTRRVHNSNLAVDNLSPIQHDSLKIRSSRTYIRSRGSFP